MPEQNVARRAMSNAFRGMAPLLIGVVPFGLIIGITAAATAIGGGLGYLSSIIIFGGAAQLAAIELIDQGAAAVVIAATGIVINSRHVMYSAALADQFRPFPRLWRIGLPYLLTDQAFVLSAADWRTETDPTYRRWYFFGVGIGLWVPWQIAVAVGVIVGAEIPADWSLDFIVPLVFLGLLIPSVRDRPSLAAALVGGVVAVLAADIPWHLGLMVATLCGVVAGVAARRLA